LPEYVSGFCFICVSIQYLMGRRPCARAVDSGLPEGPSCRCVFPSRARSWRPNVAIRPLLRAHSEISSQISGVEAPGWQGAKVQAYREYEELSQRGQASMQRRLKWEVIFA